MIFGELFRFVIGQGGFFELNSIAFALIPCPEAVQKGHQIAVNSSNQIILFLLLCHEESHRNNESDRRTKGVGVSQGYLQNLENMFYTNRSYVNSFIMPGASRVQRIVELVQTSSPRSEATPDASRPIKEALMVLLSSRHLFVRRCEIPFLFFLCLFLWSVPGILVNCQKLLKSC